MGDLVGVGAVVDCCMKCKACEKGEEHLCENGMTMSFGYDITHGHIATDSGWTYGGYSSSYTVNQRFVFKIPDGFPLEAAGPCFCAGITMYYPLATYKAKEGGMHVGIVGIGGLGQMGIRLAKAMGNTVTAISTSPHKEEAAKEIGADKFIVSTDPESMKEEGLSLDLIVNTVPEDHDLNLYLPLLATKGVLVQLGLALAPHAVKQTDLIFRNLSITGSIIGGMPLTQECIDFCWEHNIIPKIKVVTAAELGEVYKEIGGKNDSILRNVLDIEASKETNDSE